MPVSLDVKYKHKHYTLKLLNLYDREKRLYSCNKCGHKCLTYAGIYSHLRNHHHLKGKKKISKSHLQKLRSGREEFYAFVKEQKEEGFYDPANISDDWQRKKDNEEWEKEYVLKEAEEEEVEDEKEKEIVRVAEIKKAAELKKAEDEKAAKIKRSADVKAAELENKKIIVAARQMFANDSFKGSLKHMDAFYNLRGCDGEYLYRKEYNRHLSDYVAIVRKNKLK